MLEYAVFGVVSRVDTAVDLRFMAFSDMLAYA